MVGFGLVNLNTSLTKLGRSCNITSLFLSYCMYWSYIFFYKKIHYNLFTHKIQVILYYWKIKLCLYHIVDLISRWYSLTSNFINLYVCFFINVLTRIKRTNQPVTHINDTRQNQNLKWSVMMDQYFTLSIFSRVSHFKSESTKPARCSTLYNSAIYWKKNVIRASHGYKN
jgi:hypothetical protein